MRKLAAFVISVGVTFAVSTPAQAVWVRPSQAPLLNAAGEDSTCVLTTKGSTFMRDGIRRLKHKAEVVCETGWMRHKTELYASVVQDGGRVRITGVGGALAAGVPMTTGGATSVGPICSKNAWGLPWDPQPGVTYQVILSSKATVKATIDNSGEPWTARTEKLVEVTC